VVDEASTDNTYSMLIESECIDKWVSESDDGIYQAMNKRVTMSSGDFIYIEFGVEDFTESNCRFLLIKDDWRGYINDGSKENIKNTSLHYYWKCDLVAKEALQQKIILENYKERVNLI